MSILENMASYKGHLSHGDTHALWVDQMHQFVLTKNKNASEKNKEPI